MAKPINEVAVVRGYHAHVYYDAGSKDAAARLHEAVGDRFQVVLGREGAYDQHRTTAAPIVAPLRKRSPRPRAVAG